MSRIALTHNQLCGTDGVSLEVDKWKTVLQRMGHSVCYIAGNVHPDVITIPELSFEHPDVKRLLVEGTSRWSGVYADGAALLAEAQRVARQLAASLEAIVARERIDVLMPHNLLSVGYNLPAVIALSQVIARSGIRASGHWHDFWWEGEQSGEVNPTCAEARQLLTDYAPPLCPNLRHTVINSLGRRGMRSRKGYEAATIPNVFDYSQRWVVDDYNADLRRSLGIRESDIVFLQATRVMDRKAIELAIDVVAEVNSPRLRSRLEAAPLYDGRRFGPADRIALLCAGYVETFGISGSYQDKLRRHAQERKVELVFGGERVKHSRGCDGQGKLYSLFADAYPHADMVTYCSVWEGFGNQFLEAICARQPVVLFEYPVYVSDLKPLGFDVVSLGSEYRGTVTRELLSVTPQRVAQAAEQAVTMLTDRQRRAQAVQTNLRVAQEHFSLEALERHLAAAVAPQH